jgi:hypothetical protein
VSNLRTLPKGAHTSEMTGIYGDVIYCQYGAAESFETSFGKASTWSDTVLALLDYRLDVAYDHYPFRRVDCYRI